MLDGTVEMAAGLVVDADPVGSGIGKRGDEVVGILDHEVAIEGQACGLAQALDDRRAEGDVGDEVAVHDVDMDDGSATAFGCGNLVGEVREVGGQDGGEQLDHRCVSLRGQCISGEGVCVGSLICRGSHGSEEYGLSRIAVFIARTRERAGGRLRLGDSNRRNLAAPTD